MPEHSFTPDLSTLAVPRDTWSEAFWDGTAEKRLTMPRCTQCGTFRWPVGPFCPKCLAQPIEWVSAGHASIYSFTILPMPAAAEGEPPRHRIPVLVEFADAPGVRLPSSLIDAPLDGVAIGAKVEPVWVEAADGIVPLFRLA